MNKNLIVRIAEGLGNQLFMYAHAYALSKKLNCKLYIYKYIIILLLATAGCGSFHSENVSERPWNEPRGFQYHGYGDWNRGFGFNPYRDATDYWNHGRLQNGDWLIR